MLTVKEGEDLTGSATDRLVASRASIRVTINSATMAMISLELGFHSLLAGDFSTNAVSDDVNPDSPPIAPITVAGIGSATWFATPLPLGESKLIEGLGWSAMSKEVFILVDRAWKEV